MTKRIFSFLATCACCLALCVSLTSCPDPDPEPDGPGPAPTPATSVSDFGGTHLVAVGGYAISYDSQGRFVSAKGKWSDTRIDYTNDLIYIDGDSEVGPIKFNNNGYISEITTNHNTTTDSRKYSYSYNSQGCLVESVIKGINNQTGEIQFEVTITLTWNNGNITKVSWLGIDNDYDDSDVFSCNYYLTYGEMNNPFKQYMYGVFEELEICEDINDIPLIVGLLGKGPAKLPISMTYEDSYGESDTYNISYVLNDNGTISSETFDGDKYIYSYRVIGDSRAYVADGEQQPVKGREGFTKHGRHRRHHKTQD